MTKDMNTKKKNLAKLLRGIADMLEKESVQIQNSVVNMKAGHVEGVDPKDFQFATYHPDGEKSIEIRIDLYDPEQDESSEAYDPMDEIGKEAGN